eukprot:1149252-Pelagomonas_calceolata.AAC.1
MSTESLELTVEIRQLEAHSNNLEARYIPLKFHTSWEGPKLLYSPAIPCALEPGCLNLNLLLVLSSQFLPCSALVLLLLLLGDGVGAQWWGLLCSDCSCPPSLLFIGWNEMRSQPGVAIAGAAVVTGRGEELGAVAFYFVGVAGTAPALGGTVDAPGVGEGAGNAKVQNEHKAL